MATKAQFHFQLEDGSPLVLTYNLQQNSLIPKWEQIIRTRSANKDELELKITNKTSNDLEKLINILNNIVEEINDFYDKELPLFTSTDELDRKILNFLHEEFENYGERHRLVSEVGYGHQAGDPNKWPGRGFRKEFHQHWLDLNQWIHITEAAMESRGDPNFSCLIQYMPFEENGAPIEEIDKLFLDTRFSWGSLYLGYNTLGKDYSHAASDNDQRLISNGQIKVQKTLSSEVWLNFSEGGVQPNMTELQFYDWYKSLTKELQDLIPINDLNTLALGRYYIGELEFDETFLNYHPIHSDWLIADSELRCRWNLDVFGKIVKATDIKVF